MLIDKYIEELTKLRQAHGPDLEVMRISASGFISKAPLPRMAYRHQKLRTSFHEAHHYDSDRGEKVVRV